MSTDFTTNSVPTSPRLRGEVAHDAGACLHRERVRGTLNALSAGRVPLTPTLSPQAGRGSRPSVLRRLCLSLAALLIAGACALVWWILSLGPTPLGEHLAFSTLVVDRDGKLLRPYTTPDGRWRLPATRDSVDPRFLNLLYAYEDRRFPTHHGIDPLALGRAFSQLI